MSLAHAGIMPHRGAVERIPRQFPGVEHPVTGW